MTISQSGGTVSDSGTAGLAYAEADTVAARGECGAGSAVLMAGLSGVAVCGTVATRESLERAA